MTSKLFEKKPSETKRLKNTNSLQGIQRERAAEKVGALVFKGLDFKEACEKCGFESETCEWMFKSDNYNGAIETRKIEELRRNNSKFEYSHDKYCKELYAMSKEFDNDSSKLKAMELLGKALKYFETESINISNTTNNFNDPNFIKRLEADARERREKIKAITVSVKEIKA